MRVDHHGLIATVLEYKAPRENRTVIVTEWPNKQGFDVTWEQAAEDGFHIESASLCHEDIAAFTACHGHATLGKGESHD